jgi:hypothetical protein
MSFGTPPNIARVRPFLINLCPYMLGAIDSKILSAIPGYFERSLIFCLSSSVSSTTCSSPNLFT